MRLIKLDECVDLAIDAFSSYVQPYGLSLMYGEIPSVDFAIHRTGTKERDWLAGVRFKNNPTISLFSMEVWLDDVFRLCRRAKIWLVTSETFTISVLYYMLQPLFQFSFMDRTKGVYPDYDSMMISASKETIHFIDRFFQWTDYDLQRVVLEVLKYHMMEYTNHWYGPLDEDGTYSSVYRDWQERYEDLMIDTYELPYRTARARKANTHLVDLQGFRALERRTDGKIIHDKGEIEDEQTPEA